MLLLLERIVNVGHLDELSGLDVFGLDLDHLRLEAVN